MPSRLRLRRFVPVAAATLAGALIATAAYAQTGDLGLAASNPGLTTMDIRTLVGQIIRAVLGLIGIVMVGLVMYAGFLWMTSQGNPEKIEKAKKTMTGAVIGLAIVLLSYSIVLFIARALGLGTGAGGSGSDCPSGSCATDAGLAGSGKTFRVSGVMPAGSGPNGNGAGWPHNYPIKVVFSGEVNPTTLDLKANPVAVQVWKCNRRDGDFVDSKCDASPLAITAEVAGDTAAIRPVDGKGETTAFESDYWYKVRVMSGALGGPKSAAGVMLTCKSETEPLDSAQALSGYCARAVAFNAVTDTQAPTVVLDSPSYAPALCQGAVSKTAVIAVAQDDWLVGSVSYLLDGGTTGLAPAASPAMDSNVESASPVFRSTAFSVDPSQLSEGSHRLTATATDMMGTASSAASVALKVNPGHCCNAAKDGDETGVDCGGACGACLGQSCSANGDCASGFCDPTTKLCAARAMITNVDKAAAGPGSILTITGQNFGTAAGSVTFLGNLGDASDDVVAQACNPSAWNGNVDGKGTSVVSVAVPSGAKSGPIQVTPAVGASDRTGDDFGPLLSSVFTVNDKVMPGICYLEPTQGKPGEAVTIHGSGFGTSSANARIVFGSYTNLAVATGGWTDTAIRTVVPLAASGDYDVTVSLASEGSTAVRESNSSLFNIPEDASTAPHVISVSPENGAPGTYVTVAGSGFGARLGKVKFIYGAAGSENVAYGAETICGSSWHDGYVVVKLPERYGIKGEAGDILAQPHRVVVETAAGQATADTVTFTVTGGEPGPGVCAIKPDNGPAGTPVEVIGERFGSRGNGQVNAVDFSRASSEGRCLLDLNATCAIGTDCSAAKGPCVRNPWRQYEAACSAWTENSIVTSVPGFKGDKKTWPATGSVFVLAGVRSDNGVPFRVQDCNDGASCGAGETCCSSGACVSDPKACQGLVRDSAYGLLMSTEVIPDLPQVVERPYCRAEGSDLAMQSPSPYRDQRDACVNSAVYLEFNRPLDTKSFAVPSIGTDLTVEECATAADGNGPSANCAPVAWNVPKYEWTGCSGDACTGLHLNPVLGVGKWYRVRLVSSVVDEMGKALAAGKKVGFHEPASAGGHYLDGDFDRAEGGDYVYTFKTRNSSETCQATGVTVNPAKFTIRQPASRSPFMLSLLNGCSVLQCTRTSPPAYAFAWSQSPTLPRAYLDLGYVPTEAESPCLKQVVGAYETPYLTPTVLIGEAVGTAVLSSRAAVTVKFTDPKVVAVGPVPGCLAACANAAIYAQFNVPMMAGLDGSANTLNSGNVKVYKCRNASCSAPLTALDCAVTAEYGAAGTVDSARKGRVAISCGTLEAGSYYAVRLSDDIRAETGARLTGLNYGSHYQWIFRTKESPDHLCGVDRASLEPKSSVLHYVGQRLGLRVVARSKADECSKDGQELNPWTVSWNWSLAAPNPVLGGFVNDSAASPSPDVRLQTDPSALPSSCSSTCLNNGTSVPAHVCGDGRLDGTRVRYGSDDVVGVEGCERVIGGTGDNTDWCSENCTLKGVKSVSAGGTCGNGKLETGEECEKYEGVWQNGCKAPGMTVSGSSLAVDRGCVWLGADVAALSRPAGTAACADAGAAGCCGNGKVEAGENCDMTPDSEGRLVFQGRCKEPGTEAGGSGIARELGCVQLDSRNQLPGCGDNQLGDGEQCDDGNTNDGDGCSSTCLFEGSLPSCASPHSGACQAACGNGITEEGEDSDCDVPGSTPAARHCDPQTCRHLGTAACTTSGGSNCCGNNVVDLGEDAACEDSSYGNRAEFCTDRCVLKGSSPFYKQASFCADRVKASPSSGAGEQTRCEVTTANAKVDPTQYVEVVPQGAVFDPKSESGATSTVRVTSAGLPAERSGSAAVTLQCDCRAIGGSQAEMDGYCSKYVSADGETLGCGTDSCCRAKPTARLSDTLSLPVCRNGSIPVVFDQPMNQASLARAITVYEDSGSSGSSVSPCDNATLAFTDRPAGWLARLWHGMVGFFRSLFGLTAEAAGNWWCPVKVDLSVVYGASLSGSDNYPTNVYINPKRAFGKSTTVRVRVSTAATSNWGVPLAAAYAFDVRTQPGLCTLEAVDVIPSVVFVNDAANPDYPLKAVGRGAPVTETVNGRKVTVPGPIITPVEEYSWNWKWGKEALTSPIVVNPRRNADTGSETDAARLHARNPKLGDAPSNFVPKNDVDQVMVSAVPLSGINGGTIEAQQDGVAPVYVVLCQRPWPSVKKCESLPKVGSTHYLPWGAPVECTAGDVWAPFSGDATYGLATYYCRDGQGDSATSSVLPALSETPALVTPGRDILNEYLFTFDAGILSGSWNKDAIGLRISTNSRRAGILPWYHGKGFSGEPESLKVDGYDALQDGRSTYLGFSTWNAASRKAYTNVATFTYSDAAADETKQVFGQMLANLRTNSGLRDSGICADGTGQPLTCATDTDCWADANGTVLATRQSRYFCDQTVGRCAVTCAESSDCRRLPEATTEYSGYSQRWCDTAGARKVCRVAGAKTSADPLAYESAVGLTVPCSDDLACRTSAGTLAAARDAYSCDATAAKLARDTKRWADLLSMRGYLMEYLGRTGGVPKLSSGTFVPSVTVDTWPSWKEYLTPALGDALATDPLDQHARCYGTGSAAGYDAATCWNKVAGTYTCPSGSHVYQYQSHGGVDFTLKADLEVSGVTWAGSNCIDFAATSGDCSKANGCSVVDGRCAFAVGNVAVGNTATSSANCAGSAYGASGTCGDGVINGTEVCEIGQTDSTASCNANGRVGTKLRTCNSKCSGWDYGSACVTGTCGDGQVQAAYEACDDGTLNGKYGYCNATCTAVSARCGDGIRQPNEQCDCALKNGKYAFNGVLATATDTKSGADCSTDGASAASCDWDCQRAAPRCGDGITNGGEQCDGGLETRKGYCGDPAKTGCNTNADCPTGYSCQTGTAVCPKAEQTVSRPCLTNNAATTGDDAKACTWGDWQCSTPGSCGNGIKESDEECDDGDAKMGDNTRCLKTATAKCVLNKCGDGYVNKGVEECDTGVRNGTLTPAPDYGVVQNYCTASCKLATKTGGFCGDGILQSSTTVPVGPEKCEPGLATNQDYRCVSVSSGSMCKGAAIETSASVCSASCAVGCANPEARACDNKMSAVTSAKSVYSLADGTYSTRTCSVDDHDCDGLSDACDPDDDNDGVPDVSDCAPFNAAVHGSYRTTGGSCNVDEVAEVCDGIDNNCDGSADQVIKFNGTVRNVKNGELLDGGVFSITCLDNNALITTVTSGSSGAGRFSVSVDYPGGCKQIQVAPVSGSGSAVCVDTSQLAYVPGSLCPETVPEYEFQGVPRPGGPLDKDNSLVTAYILWSTPYPRNLLDGLPILQKVTETTMIESGRVDLDLMAMNNVTQKTAQTKAGCFGVFLCSDSGGPYIKTDKDATGEYYSLRELKIGEPLVPSKERQPPETMTIHTGQPSGAKYHFYAINWSNSDGSPTAWGDLTSAKFRMVDNQCVFKAVVNAVGPVVGISPKYWNIGTFDVTSGTFIPVNRLEGMNYSNDASILPASP